MSTAPEFLYRFGEVNHAPPLDEFENPIMGSGGVSLYLHTFPIVKKTPCGAWIDIGFGSRKFVNLTARKKYACASQAEAWDSFVARK